MVDYVAAGAIVTCITLQLGVSYWAAKGFPLPRIDRRTPDPAAPAPVAHPYGELPPGFETMPGEPVMVRLREPVWAKKDGALVQLAANESHMLDPWEAIAILVEQPRAVRAYKIGDRGVYGDAIGWVVVTGPVSETFPDEPPAIAPGQMYHGGMQPVGGMQPGTVSPFYTIATAPGSGGGRGAVHGLGGNGGAGMAVVHYIKEPTDAITDLVNDINRMFDNQDEVMAAYETRALAHVERLHSALDILRGDERPTTEKLDRSVELHKQAVEKLERAQSTYQQSLSIKRCGDRVNAAFFEQVSDRLRAEAHHLRDQAEELRRQYHIEREAWERRRQM